MSHHKKPTKIDTLGREVRLRRDKQRAPVTMTRDSGHAHVSNPPNPRPTGGAGWVTWLLDTFHGYVGPKGDRLRRKVRARMKVHGRRVERRRNKKLERPE
jgi:hypothetical protein